MATRAVRRWFNPQTVALLGAVVVVACVFAITLVWRLPLASEITGDRTEIVTAQLYAWLQNWIHEGPFSIHFMMPYDPLSIESPDFQHRAELYRSYPPGSLVPPYLLAFLYKAAPIAVLTSYDLACHAVLVIAIVCAVFVVTARASGLVASSRTALPLLSSALLAISAGIFLTVANGPAFFFARVYVFDVAVLPWFGLSILLEAIYTSRLDSARIARTTLILQMVIFTIGIWTDWMTVPLIFVWIALRIAESKCGMKGVIPTRRQVPLAIAILLANLALISIWRILAGTEQDGHWGAVAELNRTIYKFVYRAGFAEDSMTMSWFIQRIRSYLTSYFAIGFFQFVYFMVAAGTSIIVTFKLSRRFTRSEFLWPITSVAALSTIPVLLHLCLLPQHTYHHEFAVLKLGIPMALLVLTLAPAAAGAVLTRQLEAHFRVSPRTCETIFSIFVCSVAVSGIYFSMTRYQVPQMHFPSTRGGIGIVGTIIGRNVEYEDVVFSPQIEIDRMSEEAGFSRKLVHRSLNIDRDLPNITSGVCKPFNLIIVSDELNQPKRAEPPSEIWRDSGLVFYRWRNLPPTKTGCADTQPPQR